jgi:hypothetical protein
MEVHDIIRAVGAATSMAGVTETCKCDYGSRAHDWEIGNHDPRNSGKGSLQKGMNYGSVKITRCF